MSQPPEPHWTLGHPGAAAFSFKIKGQWRDSTSGQTGGPWQARGSRRYKGKQIVRRTQDQAREGGRQISPRLCSAQLSKINDRSIKASWEQILLSSESPREGGWKIPSPPSLISKWEHWFPGGDGRALGARPAGRTPGPSWAVARSRLTPGAPCPAEPSLGRSQTAEPR